MDSEGHLIAEMLLGVFFYTQTKDIVDDKCFINYVRACAKELITEDNFYDKVVQLNTKG